MILELRRWIREEIMKRAAFFKDLKGSGALSSPRKRGPSAGDMRWPWAPAFAGATKKRFDLKRSRFKGGVLSFAAVLSLLATAAAAADNLPSNSTECAFPRGSRSAPIVDGHRLQPRACAFAASPDVSKSDAKVVDELYRELIGHSATTPPSPPAKDTR
jgi:hypothetical protein